MSYEISVGQVKGLIDRGEKLRLIDVREPAEFAIARIEGAELIPMRTIPGAVARLGSGDERLIVFCHHGVRSLNAVHWLRGQGIEAVSMAGGIDAWSVEVDPSVPRY